jgi:hypothetical protein
MNTLGFQFHYTKIDGLPRLAWVAHFKNDNQSTTVEHGPWVETHPRFFFEGAWNGEFAAGDAPKATVCLGSGGTLTQEGVIFATPSHMLERLHLIRSRDGVWISNSLPFILAKTEDSVDPAYKYYHFDLMTNMRGMKRYKREITTKNGNTVRLYFHCNVLVKPNLEIIESPKPQFSGFTSFQDYVGFLSTTISDVHKNSTARERLITYEPLATISSGYDSPACAVLAKKIGCKEAVTFSEARPGYASLDDSGREIAQLLGLHVTEFDRQEYLRMSSFPEAEFLAYGAGGEEVVFAPLERVLPGKLFFTGYLGDAVWNKNPPRTNQELLMLYPGGSSFGEFRLRVGFIHFPLPTVGYIHHPSVHAISNLPEMQPWSIGNLAYDRPIPRRLIEEQGVPRHLFGQDKKAITQPLWNTERLDEAMSSASFRDFSEFARSIPMFQSSLDRHRFTIMRSFYELNLRVLWRLQSLARRFRMTEPSRTLISERYSQSLGLTALTFHWGLNKTLKRYMSASGRGEKG